MFRYFIRFEFLFVHLYRLAIVKSYFTSLWTTIRIDFILHLKESSEIKNKNQEEIKLINNYRYVKKFLKHFEVRTFYGFSIQSFPL